MDAKLIVIGGKANKSEVKLKLPTTIGRSRKADLTVAHPKVSRHHCEIFEREGVLMVKDFGSLNGTFIENNRITESVLKPGDKLTVGPLTFVAVYEPTGPIPADLPNPADLPTPEIGKIELPTTNAKAGRSAADTVSARPRRPSPIPIVAPPAAPEDPDETPLAAELPQTPTLPGSAAESEPEAAPDDFSWLTGDTETAPSAEANDQPPVVPSAFAETVSLQRAEPAAEPRVPDLRIPEEPLGIPAADEEVIASNDQADEDPQDFSWLDNAKDDPLDFSAVEEEAKPTIDPEAVSASPSSDKTTVQVPGPTVALAKKERAPEPASAVPPEVFSPAAFSSETTEEPSHVPQVVEESPVAEDESPVAEDEPAAEEGVPDFAAFGQSTSEEEPAFPPIVADRPAEAMSTASHTPPPPRAAAKPAKAKGWWPFGGKKKEPAPAKATAKAPAAAPEAAAEEASEPVEASEEPVAAAAPVAAPEFIMPAPDEPEPEPAAAEDSGGEDDALGQFFKSLK